MNTLPILQNQDDVARTYGDPLDTIWWQGRTWAVTSYGIEMRNGRYYVARDCLNENWPDYDWMKHISSKAPQFDAEDFRTAYLVALVLHDVPLHPQIRAELLGVSS